MFVKLSEFLAFGCAKDMYMELVKFVRQCAGLHANIGMLIIPSVTMFFSLISSSCSRELYSFTYFLRP